MTREDSVRKLLRQEKGVPSSKKYLIIFGVVVILAAAYLLVAGVPATLVPGAAGAAPRVTNEKEAQQASTNLGNALENASSGLDDIENILG